MRTRIIFGLLLCAAVLLLAGCRWWGAPQETPAGGTPGQPSTPGNTTAGVTCPIDGLPADPASIARRPLAVMIENSPSARPQSGLSQACAVYEGITEGGITRFLAIFLHNDPAEIGPVRSVRPHFLDLAREYDPALVHCGESYEALQILAMDTSIDDLDQLKYPKPFWRDDKREKPHNLYTSAARLRAFLPTKRWENSGSVTPHFTGGGPMSGAPAPVVRIGFGGGVHYGLRLVYDAARGGYLRYMDGTLHVERATGAPLVATNVIIQRVAAMQYPDSKLGTYDVTVVGSGAGEFVTGGQHVPLSWRKDSNAAQTVFTTADGQPLPFQAGQTWIELVPEEGKVDFPTPKPAAPAKRRNVGAR